MGKAGLDGVQYSSNSSGCGVMRTVNILLFQFQVGVDEVIAEHATTGQELTVCIQCGQRFVPGTGNGRHFSGFFGGRSYRFLSMASPGWILLMIPSRPAIRWAAKARYGLAAGSRKRTSMRRAFGLSTTGIRMEAERLQAE